MTIPRHIRVFISSPGDVPDERLIAAKVINDLAYDPLLKGKITVESVAWDQPGSATPMLATMTPQEAINQGMPKPADCDVVVVIFWTRMGTPLPPEYLKPNGDRFQSGTEWEYLNAVDATRDSERRGEQPAIPQIIIYRRTAEPQVTFDDPKFDEKKQQWERVKAFFRSFTNPDGSIRQGYNPYATPDEFRAVFEAHMKKLIGQLLETTRAVNPSVAAAPLPPIWNKSPFPGLRAFTPDDEPIFYGRGAETDTLIAKVRDSRFVAVVGASGSGKSSLVGAGLLPRLTANSIEGSKDWILPSRAGDSDDRVWVGLRFTPGEYGNNPFLALANKITARMNRTARDLADDLAAHPETFPVLLTPMLENKPAWSETFIFIDQFEELFTQVDAAKIAPFVALLKAIADSDRVHVVVTLRADFYARCVENPTLAALLQAGTYPLSAPSPVALGDMIAKPAERANLTFQQGLIQHILEDTGSDPGALALMAYLLDELYKSGRTDGQLTLEEYDALGGVRGAIGKRAEEVVQRLTVGQQKTLPRLFSEIVDVDGRGRATRRRAELGRFTGDADISAAIDKLTNERLLVQSGGLNQVSTLEVAHEALLREWDRLAMWITGAQTDLQLRRQLEQSVLDYTGAKDADKADYLLVGGRLAEAQKWRARYPNEKPETLGFIAASETAEAARIAAEERRIRELATRTRIAAGVIIMAILIGVMAAYLILTANTQVINANVAANAANTEVENANAVLTQIPPTVTFAYIQVGNANATLTPVSMTLTAVAIQVSYLNLRSDTLSQLLSALDSNGKPNNWIAAIQYVTAIIATNPQFGFSYILRGGAYIEIGNLDGAIADYSKAIELDPENVGAYRGRGLAKQDKGDLDGAIADYSKAIELDPNDAFAYTDLGSVKQDKGDLDGAIADYSKAIELDPKNVGAYTNRGSVKHDKGDLDGAIADYSNAIELDPTVEEAYNNRGNAKREKGDLNGAIADYSKAIELNPKVALPYNNRGNAKRDKGDLDGAIADYSKAIELDPNYAKPYYNRGNAKSNKGDLDGALTDYSKAIELDPKYAHAYDGRGLAKYNKGDLDGAIADYSKAIELDPKDALAYVNRGNAKYHKSDWDGAIADYSNAIELDPMDALAYYNRGNAKGNKGDLDGAITDYSKTVELDPKNALAYNNRGHAKYAKGDIDGAIADYSKAIEIDSKLALAYINRGNAKSNKVDLDGAIADYSNAIELDPMDALAYYNRGNAKRNKGDLDGAITDYSKAIELNPNYAHAYNNRGDAKDAKEDLDGAIADYSKAIELDPMSPNPYYGRGIVYRAQKKYSEALADFRRYVELAGSKATQKSQDYIKELETLVAQYTPTTIP